MSEKLEEVIGSVLMDENDEIVDVKEGFISQEEYDKILNDEFIMMCYYQLKI